MRHELYVPDLGLRGRPIKLSVWLVDAGTEVAEGDRVVELHVGDATIDLPAPASGTLVETFADEDDEVLVGDLLAVIRSVDDAADS